MPIQKLTIQDFIKLSTTTPVFDVRSPGEFNHAHIPNAISLPLFTDEERKIVGTTYKKQSREKAIKMGLDFFGPKMKTIIETVEQLTLNQQQETRNIVVHCWRGGMRSAAVSWLLDLYGFKVHTLIGGYKAYRNWVLQQFEKKYNINIIGGYTGSGKTLVLQELANKNRKVVDLEKIAHHKGSSFGSLGEQPQPTQEMFDNLLAKQLFTINHQPSTISYLEDESQRIGNIKIPDALWKQMRKSNIFFIEIPFEERLEYISKEYGKFAKEDLINAVIRIEKRLGGLEAKNCINFLQEGNYTECFRILLKYYDKWYLKGLYNRENANSLITKIECNTVDSKAIAATIAEKVANAVSVNQ